MLICSGEERRPMQGLEESGQFYIRYIFSVYCAPQSSQFGCKINKHVCMYVCISSLSCNQ